MKLTYFNAPARAAPARLMMAVAQRTWDDCTVAREDWPAFKRDKLKGGQLPILELDGGRVLAQSNAINVYIAAETGLYPSDSWHVALGHMAIGITDDLSVGQYAYFLEKDPEAKAAKLKEILEGPQLAARANALQAACCDAVPGDFITGAEPIWADYVVYCFMSGFVSGFYGVPRDFWKRTPALHAYKERIANLEPVKAYHAEKKGDPMYDCFQPEGPGK